MKNFKRITAIVLAAVLALTVLTACSQSVPLTPDELGKAWIATELNGMNSIRSESLPQLENDSYLESLCQEALGNLQEDTTRYPLEMLIHGIIPDGGRTVNILITYDTSSCDTNETYELTPLTTDAIESSKNSYQALSSLKDTNSEGYAKAQAFYNSRSKVGFAYRIFSDGTVYTASAFVLNS